MRILLTEILLVGAFVILPCNADADRKHYSGADCVALGTNQSQLSYNVGIAHNVMNHMVQIYCPLVKDENTIRYGWVYLWNRSTREAMFSRQLHKLCGANA